MNYKYFSLRRHERPVCLFALLLAIVLQAIIICRYNDIFTNPGPKYWAVFLHNFSVSGYDPITYSVVTDWTAKYNVYRHPLLAFFMAPLYWLNLGLTADVWYVNVDDVDGAETDSGLACADFKAQLSAGPAYVAATYVAQIDDDVLPDGLYVNILS